MKLHELTESTKGKLLGIAISALQAAQKKYADKSGKESSHSIGGNISAVVSGKLQLRGPYNMKDQYSSVKYDELLEIGNNVEGGGLQLARQIFKTISDKLEEEDGVTTSMAEKDFIAFEKDGEKIGLDNGYARSWSWVGVRKLN
jgi:hypothetical protein